MARRRQPSLVEESLESLTWAFLRTPWWVGPTSAVAVFGLIRYVVPLFPTAGSTSDRIVTALSPLVSWAAVIVITAAWAVAEITKFFDRRRFDRTADFGSIADLNWQQFERHVCDAYRRRGYTAAVVGGPSAGWVAGGEEVQVLDRERVVARLLPPVERPRPDSLSRAKAVWGDTPAGKSLSEIVFNGRGEPR